MLINGVPEGILRFRKVLSDERHYCPKCGFLPWDCDCDRTAYSFGEQMRKIADDLMGDYDLMEDVILRGTDEKHRQ